MQPLDEAAVRRVLRDLPARQRLPADAIEQIASEDDWIAIVLQGTYAKREQLAALHRQLSAAWPRRRIELRAGGVIHRGGHGFGDGRHVIAILGGKGGVGKSTVAVNLAYTLLAMGATAGVIDADINAPDIPHMLDVHPMQASDTDWQLWSTQVPAPSRWRQPFRRSGLEVMSIGFVVPERIPPALRARFEVSGLLRYLLFDVAWTAEIVLIDAPPGTGEEIRVLAGELPLSAAIFVTTPQDVAQMDAERTLTLLHEQKVPVIGMIQNMAWLACPHCAEPIDLFAKSNRLADAGVPILARIPFDVELSAAADRGRPLVLANPRGDVAREFARAGRAVTDWLASCPHPPTPLSQF